MSAVPAPALWQVRDAGLVRATAVVMAGALFLLGLRTRVVLGLPVGTVAGLALAPMWLSVLRRWRGARSVMVAGVLALATGAWLGWSRAASGAFSAETAVADTAPLVSLLVGVGVVVWARQLLSVPMIGVCLGLGLLANAVVNPGALTATNPWKFGFLVPVAVILLALASRRPDRRLRQAAAAVALGLSCAVSDARSYFATFLLVTVLVLVQRRRPRMSRQRWWGWTVATLVALVLVVYNVGQALLLEGMLGEAAQQRSAQQLRSGGSLLLGGRPEAAATFGLMGHEPAGYGIGAVPTVNDVAVARSSMFEALGYRADEGYLKNFMFDGAFELHSTLADLWVHFGLGGVLLAGVLTYLVLRGLAVRVAAREAGVLLLFLSLWTLWNLLFSPLYSALPTLVPAVGLTLFPRTEPTPAAATGAGAPRAPRADGSAP